MFIKCVYIWGRLYFVVPMVRGNILCCTREIIRRRRIDGNGSGVTVCSGAIAVNLGGGNRIPPGRGGFRCDHQCNGGFRAAAFSDYGGDFRSYGHLLPIRQWRRY